MWIHWLPALTVLLFTLITTEQASLNVTVIERGVNNIANNNSVVQFWTPATTKKILIRVTRLNENLRKSMRNNRYRRELMDSIRSSDFVINIAKAIEDVDSSEKIWGMAKKVAITVFVGALLCIFCCVVTTICICVKCCCPDSKKRKRNQGFVTAPQAIVIHTNSPHYQQQYTPSQASQQPWNTENHPMLPQPSAPPQALDDYLTERPPPYEKIFSGR